MWGSGHRNSFCEICQRELWSSETPKWRERGLAPNENSLSLEDCTPWVSDPCHRCFGKAVCPQEGFMLQQFWQDWCLWEWRSSQRTVSCGRDPTAEQRKNSSPWTNRSQVTNWPKPPCPNLPALSVGGAEGKKAVVKAYFTSHYPPLTQLIINWLYTCKFEPVLHFKCFSPSPHLNSWALW